jgi:lysozyme
MLMDELAQRIEVHESLRLFPYTDTVGKLTIGYGRNLQDRGLSKAEATYLMMNDLDESRMELIHYDWFNKLDKVRQEVLIELHFNIGLTRLLKFKQMIAYLIIGDYTKAAEQLLDSLWAKQVGRTRSQDMANRLTTGKY